MIKILKQMAGVLFFLCALLLVSLPGLVLSSSHWHHTTTEDIWITLAAFWISGAFLWALIFLLLRDHLRASAFTFFLSILLLLYGPTVSFFLGDPATPGVGLFKVSTSVYEMPFFLGFIAIVIGMFKLFGRIESKNLFDVCLYFSLLSLILAGQFTFDMWRKYSEFVAYDFKKASFIENEPIQEKNAENPHIIHIMLDGFAPERTLKRIFGASNANFLDFLKKRGFQVAENAWANYPSTVQSLTSMFNGRYLTDNRWYKKPPSWHRHLHSNAWVGFLRSRGFKIKVYPGNISTEFSNAELKHPYRVNELLAVSSGFIQLPWVRELLSRHWHSLHRSQVKYTFEELEQLKLGSEPTYVFAHILAPHPPFVISEKGQPSLLDRPFIFQDGPNYGPRGPEYKAGYLAQHKYISDRLRKVLNHLHNECKENCLILIHSDHGSGHGWEKEAEESDIAERYGIHLSVKLPSDSKIPDNMFSGRFPLVNVFRMVLNEVFKTEKPLLENKIFWSNLDELVFPEVEGEKKEEVPLSVEPTPRKVLRDVVQG